MINIGTRIDNDSHLCRIKMNSGISIEDTTNIKCIKYEIQI